MSRIPKPQEIYRHFKGNLYQIITLAENSETGEAMVIYQALYGEFKVYARPLEMFVSKVDREKYPDVEQEYRFALQETAVIYAGMVDISAGGVPAETQESSEENAKVASGLYEFATISERNLAEETACQERNVDSEETACQEQNLASAEIAYQEQSPDSGEMTLDPLVWEFLDADSHEKRLNILSALHHRITDSMITTMSIACDIEVADGDLEERYQQLRNCLLMLDRFEIRR